MNINNPFESGQIKNYLLLYASIVVIMVLFFIASTLFHDVKEVEKKIYSTEMPEVSDSKTETEVVKKSKFKLMDRAY